MRLEDMRDWVLAGEKRWVRVYIEPDGLVKLTMSDNYVVMSGIGKTVAAAHCRLEAVASELNREPPHAGQ